jgi:hypothetical protein
MNPCRFLKGRDALAAPFPSSPNTREGAQRGGKRELPEHHLHASTCGPSSRERVGQRTRTPATEHNDQEAHATVTGRKRKMRRPKSPHPPQNQPASIVRPSLCSRSHSADSDRKIKKKRERAEGRSSITRPNPTRNPNQIIIVNGRHSAWK